MVRRVYAMHILPLRYWAACITGGNLCQEDQPLLAVLGCVYHWGNLCQEDQPLLAVQDRNGRTESGIGPDPALPLRYWAASFGEGIIAVRALPRGCAGIRFGRCQLPLPQSRARSRKRDLNSCGSRSCKITHICSAMRG